MSSNKALTTFFNEEFSKTCVIIDNQIFNSSILLQWLEYYMSDTDLYDKDTLSSASNFFMRLKNLILMELILSFHRLADKDSRNASFLYLQKAIDAGAKSGKIKQEDTETGSLLLKKYETMLKVTSKLRNRQFAHLGRKPPTGEGVSFNQLKQMLEAAAAYRNYIYSTFADTSFLTEIPYKGDIGMAALTGLIKDGKRIRNYERRMIKEGNYDALRAMGEDINPTYQAFLAPAKRQK